LACPWNICAKAHYSHAKGKPTYEISTDRAEHDDEPEAKQAMTAFTVTEHGVDTEARCTKKGGQYLFGYKQHTVVNNDGLVQGLVTTAANTHDSQPFIGLIEQCDLPEGKRICADKGYTSAAHDAYLKTKKLKNGIQDKAVKGKPLSVRQKERNKRITLIRFVVERTFGGEALWFGGKRLRYVGTAKAHAWHVLQAMAYNLKRLPVLWVKRNFTLKQIQCG
jgi:IS5 family transposase